MAASIIPLAGWCFSGVDEVRILLISGSLPPMRCGVGDYTDALARALSTRRENRVAVLTSMVAGKEDVFDPAKSAADSYERFACIDRWTMQDFPAARQIFRSWKPDVVHLQYPTLGYRSSTLPSLLPLMAWQAGAVAVRTWHEAFSGRNSMQFLLQAAAPGPYIVVRPNFSDLMWSPLRPVLRQRGTTIAGASVLPKSTLGPQERAALRQHYLNGQKRLIVFFGFVYPAKGVDQLFDVADPMGDAIVIAGEVDADTHYSAKIRTLSASSRWSGRATLTGFLPVPEISDLLAAADVVVLPFVEGGGSWNSSISAAVLQGTPVVTTARERHGLSEEKQVYFARPNDISDLRSGLDLVIRKPELDTPTPDLGADWARIRDEHMKVYDKALSGRRATLAS